MPDPETLTPAAERPSPPAAERPATPAAERPCIKICRYEEDTEWCLGCGMTKREKKAWKRAPEYRAAILANLPARMEALSATGHATGKDAKK